MTPLPGGAGRGGVNGGEGWSCCVRRGRPAVAALGGEKREPGVPFVVVTCVTSTPTALKLSIMSAPNVSWPTLATMLTDAPGGRTKGGIHISAVRCSGSLSLPQGGEDNG